MLLPLMVSSTATSGVVRTSSHIDTNWRRSESDDAHSYPQRPLPDCACCCSTADECQAWLRCVAGGVMLPVPTNCPLLSTLLAFPLLECVALLDAHTARLPLTSTAADCVLWSVTSHHILHAIHCQLREESAAAVLSSTRALQAALIPHRPHSHSHSHSQPHSQSALAQLSLASHILLQSAVTALVTACLTASPTTATATATTATTGASSQPDEASDAVLDGSSEVWLSASDSPSASPPTAEQLAVFVSSLNQLAALSGGGVTAVEAGGTVTATGRRLTAFICALLPATCPHSAPSSTTSDDSDVWLWTSVSWRLVSFHVQPLLRHMTQLQQAAFTSAVLRPCFHCCLHPSVQPHIPSTVGRSLPALPAASQQLINSPLLTDSSAFAIHVLLAATEHLDALLASHSAAAARHPHKRTRASANAGITTTQGTAADYIRLLLEVWTLLRGASIVPADCWRLDDLVSDLNHSSHIHCTAASTYTHLLC